MIERKKEKIKDHWAIGTNFRIPNMSFLITSYTGDLLRVPGTHSVVNFLLPMWSFFCFWRKAYLEGEVSRWWTLHIGSLTMK